MDWLFHTRYNIDLFLAAIPLQLVMLIYYVSRRHLPLRESRSFFYLMVLNLSTLVTDIAACCVIEQHASTGVIYFWNILYDASFILVPSFLLLYTGDVLHMFRILRGGGRRRWFSCRSVCCSSFFSQRR